MTKTLLNIVFSIFLLIGSSSEFSAQNTLKGIILDAADNEPIIGGNVIIQGTSEGTTTSWDGTFTFNTTREFPFTIEFSYVGYESKFLEITSNKRVTISLEENAVTIEGVEVKASRISDKQKENPLTVESMDLLAIKETPAADFYDGMGALKGVDLTAASLGFKVINTRGFNSTSPVRSLQTIDGVDNQAPGLSFSLGNFLGSSELDIVKVDLVVGASSAFYGPNAFNGVIAMETKNPFYHNGLSAMVKVGERQMVKSAIRWAQALKNKKEEPFFAYKLNFEYLRADDWEANNFDPIDDSRVDANNPGRFDAVNIYGDEYQSANDQSDEALALNQIRSWYRTGYKEEDLVDYNTRNYKANAALHFRLNPSKNEQSPELIIAGNFGSGTTVYQGDNRFSLKNITFFQNKIELQKRNKYFIRAYTTRTGAGDSYDPYFTALELQKNTKDNFEWSQDYSNYWQDEIEPLIIEAGYPQSMTVEDPPGVFTNVFDIEAAKKWLVDNNDMMILWHKEAEAFANGPGYGTSTSEAFFEPGTDRFNKEFNKITTSLRTEGGTRFFDNSALYHAHGEYIFEPTWLDKITVGANARYYTPVSKGTVFGDTADVKITNFEMGFYGGVEKAFADNKLKVSFAFRADKNENFDWLFSPAASLVFTPSTNNFLRLSFSSAIRNPTLSDQYLALDVGRATLSGNLEGVKNLVTIESLAEYFASSLATLSVLDSFNISKVRPEQVKTFEVGYRTTLFDKVYLDAGYYYSSYKDFLGYKIGADFQYETIGGPVTIKSLDVFRYSANSDNKVTTQGFSIGLNYYFVKKYSIQGNYSWNTLVKTVSDDPIIPAFNTPEHKYNIGISGRDLAISFGARKLKHLGFNINYKWIEGFLFEGSPQFTGNIPTYDMLDAQVNIRLSKINTTIKVGASNILNNFTFQTYGGPRIGRLAYVTFTYEPKTKF